MKDTTIPAYSFITNAKIPGESRVIKAKQFVILEGIFALYDDVARIHPAHQRFA
jgi:pantothenate kinase